MRIGDLKEAALNGDVRTLSLLLDSGVDSNGSYRGGCWVRGETALMFAAMGGRVEAGKLLIARGANVNQTADGRDAMYCAIMNGQTQFVKLLIENGADIKSSRGDGYFRSAKAH